jgi:uncharacterized protein YdaU (DUF1376 family)
MGKYARDTKHLSLLEHGAYNLLLDYYYSTGGLPQVSNAQSNAQLMPDHSRIYRVCGAAGKAEQDAVDSVLKFFFKLNADGFYIQEKCDEVLAIQAEKHETRVRVGRENKAKGMLKQCSSNARQTQTKTKNINPLPPKEVPEKKSGSGFYKDSGGKEGERVMNIQALLSDRGLEAAKQAAPGWDVYFHMREYDNSVNTGRIEWPKIPDKHFPAWCKAYRKGQQP